VEAKDLEAKDVEPKYNQKAIKKVFTFQLER
jgi:hypothetical protein